MELYESWLTNEDALEKSQALVRQLHQFIEERNYDFRTNDQNIASAVFDRKEAMQTAASEFFFASIGVVEMDGEKETYFLSKSPKAYVFSALNVIPWTNWVGSLYTTIKNKVRRGEYPKKLVYGSTKHLSRKPVGPTVDYEFENGLIRDLAFWFQDHLAKELIRKDLGEESEKFGLSQIVQTIDESQDEQIRSSKKGIFIFSGGPGVGKTTTALHRIPWLINEQYDENGNRLENSDELFFRTDNMAVLVWKDHLVPYLRECLIHLGLFEFPEDNVRQVDDWIRPIIRRYIPIGPGKNEYRFGNNNEFKCEIIKRALNENSVKEFLDSECELIIDAFNILVDVHARAKTVFEENSLHFNINFTIPENKSFSADEVIEFREALQGALQGAIKRKTGTLVRPNQDVSGKLKTLQSLVRRECQKCLDKISDYGNLLREFYLSETAMSSINIEQEKKNEFLKMIEQQFKDRRITDVDFHLLLWIIHLQTKGNSNKVSERHVALKTFSQIVVDEVQYYPPILLRLLAQLCRLDQGGILTLVGDLEQRISKDNNGLDSWDEIGLAIPPENFKRLGINYRSSENVFEFLALFRESLGIKELLEKPFEFDSIGTRPVISTYPDLESELEGIAISIHEKQRLQKRRMKTFAVVLPQHDSRTVAEKLERSLTDFGIRAKWASGVDVKESVDFVILTDRDSIVGLEFDCVYFACADQAVSLADSQDEIQSIWVALSRAKEFLAISRVNSDLIFDRPAFQRYYADSRFNE